MDASVSVGCYERSREPRSRPSQIFTIACCLVPVAYCPQNHFPVWNTGFVENRTDRAKSQFLVELDYRHLRVQIDCSRAQLLCRSNSSLEQFFSHALTAIAFEHCHAADFGITLMVHDSRRPHGSSIGRC